MCPKHTKNTTQNNSNHTTQKEKIMKRVCIYARTSTKQHQSTEYQINFLSQIAERNNWEIVDTYKYVGEFKDGEFVG